MSLAQVAESLPAKQSNPSEYLFKLKAGPLIKALPSSVTQLPTVWLSRRSDHHQYTYAWNPCYGVHRP